MGKKGKKKSKENTEYIKGHDELLDGAFKPLRKLLSYVGHRENSGKELYSYSDSRTWIDL